MPLIFAIDNDKRQSAQLASLLRTEVEADLVQSATAAEGLAILQDRVPDLILTSTFLSPRDESALASYLRDLGGMGAHVQTLTIPVLAMGPAGPKKKKAGMLGALRRGKTAPTLLEGCLPDTFAKEVQQYLNRAIERRIAEPQAGANVLGLTPERAQEAESWPAAAEAVAVVPDVVDVVPAQADVLLPPITASVVTITSPIVEIVAPAVVLVKPAADIHVSAAATTPALESSPFLLVEDPPERGLSGWSLLTQPDPEPVIAPAIAPVVLPLIIEATEAPAIDAAAAAAPFIEAPLVEALLVEPPSAVELAPETLVETSIAKTPMVASDSVLLAPDDAAPGVPAGVSLDVAPVPAPDATADTVRVTEPTAIAAEPAVAGEAPIVEGATELLLAGEPARTEEPAPWAEAVTSDAPAPVFEDAPAAAPTATLVKGDAEPVRLEPVVAEPVVVEATAIEPAVIEPAIIEPTIIEPVVVESDVTALTESAVTDPALAESTPAAEVSGPGDLYLDAPEPAVDGLIADLAPAVIAATLQVDGHVPVVDIAKPDDLDALASSLSAEQSLFIPEEAGVPEVPASVFLKDAPPLDPSIFLDAPAPISTPLIEQPYAGLAFKDIFLSAADRKRALSDKAPEAEAVAETVATKDSTSVEPASIDDLFVPLAAANPVKAVTVAQQADEAEVVAPIEVTDRVEEVASPEVVPVGEVATLELTPAEVDGPSELVVPTGAIAREQTAPATGITTRAGDRDFQADWDELTRELAPPMSLSMPKAVEPGPQVLAPEAPAVVASAPPIEAATEAGDEPTGTAAAGLAVKGAESTPPAIESSLPSWSWIENGASRPLADILAAVVQDSDSGEAAETATVAVAPAEAVSPADAVTAVEATSPVQAEAEAAEPAVTVEAQAVEAVAAEVPAAVVVAAKLVMAEPVAPEPVADDRDAHITESVAAEPVAAEPVAAVPAAAVPVAAEPVAAEPLAAAATEPTVAEPVAVVHEVFNADAAASWNAAVMFGAAPVDAPPRQESPATAEQAATAGPAAPQTSDAYDSVNAAAWQSVMAGRVEDEDEDEPIPAPSALDEWGGQTGPVLGEEFLALIGSAARQASLDAFDALAGRTAPQPPPGTRERPPSRPSRPSTRPTRAVQERAQRRKKPRPVQDEWGMFDPAQAGPDALFDEDAWEEDPDGRRPSPRGRTAA